MQRLGLVLVALALFAAVSSTAEDVSEQVVMQQQEQVEEELAHDQQDALEEQDDEEEAEESLDEISEDQLEELEDLDEDEEESDEDAEDEAMDVMNVALDNVAPMPPTPPKKPVAPKTTKAPAVRQQSAPTGAARQATATPKAASALKWAVDELTVNKAGTGSTYWTWAKTGKTEWCSSFVSWSFMKAGVTIGPSPHGASGVTGIPAVVNLKRWFEEHRDKWEWHPRATEPNYWPAPGDVIIFSWTRNNVMSHTGFVRDASSATTLRTMEGNVGGKAGVPGSGKLASRNIKTNPGNGELNINTVVGYGHYKGN